MRSALVTIDLNSPSNKPELWAHPLFAIRRRLLYSARRIGKWKPLTAPVLFRIREYDLLIESSLDDYIGKALYLYGVWELHETAFMKRFLQPGMTVVDVGANVGYHSLLASRLVGAAGSVLALEPSDRTRVLLQRNLELNRATNATVEGVAVTDFEGEINFFESESTQFHVLSSTIPSPLLRSENRLVKATTLDALAARNHLGRIDLIKVDVEGAEIDVFRGAAGILQAQEPPILMFESHGELIKPIAELLTEHGFALASLSSGGRSDRLLVDFDAATGWRGGKADYIGFHERHRPTLAELF